MLKIKRGCVVPLADLLSEEYQPTDYGYIANIGADKIKAVLEDFIARQTVPLFFCLELPTNESDEARLRKTEESPFHIDVYYMDGLNIPQARALLDRYGELLIDDGIARFGFGVFDNSAEIMCEKYNVVTLYAREPKEYADLFEKHKIPRTRKCLTAWDTFNETAFGESFAVTVNGMTVFDLPRELGPRGMYFAERHEER